MIPLLLNLPRKLRDLIYHYALLGQEASFVEDGLRFYVQYVQSAHIGTNLNRRKEPGENEDSDSDSEDDNCGMRSEDEERELKSEEAIYSYSLIRSHTEDPLVWLLVCRQFLSEGLEQFYKHASCTSYMIWERSRSPPDTKLTLDNNASVLTFRRVKKLKLYLKLGHERAQDYDHIVPRGKERLQDSDDDFSILVSHMRRLGSCDLEDLELWVRMFATEPDEYGDDSDVDEECYWNSYGTNLAHPSELNGYIFEVKFLKTRENVHS